MSTSSSTTIGVAAALDALVDAGALLLVVMVIPFVILAISSPIVLTLWAVLALLHGRS